MSVLGMTETTVQVRTARGVPRNSVHRASIAEVFVTDLASREGGWHASAQWPRSNCFHLSRDGRRYDELLAFETFRQAAILGTQESGWATENDHFIMTAAGLTFPSESMPSAREPIAIDLDIDCTWSPAKRRVILRAVISHQGGVVAEGHGQLTVLQPALYRRLRSLTDAQPLRHEASPIDPFDVGRIHTEDVLLQPVASSKETFLLAVDTAHPVHFDHSNDHVPGMALIDAARQATLLRLPGYRLRSATFSFTSFIELSRPALVETEILAHSQHIGLVRCSFLQDDRTCAEGTIEIIT